MKKVLFPALALLLMSALSCTKDDGPTGTSAPVVRSYQVLSINRGDPYAKEVYTPTYGPDGRVVKTVFELYMVNGSKSNLSQVEIMDLDYDASVAYETHCWEIMTPGDLSVVGPSTYPLEFDGGGKLKKATENDYVKEFGYDGDQLVSLQVTGPETDLLTKYTWNGGDLVEVNQNSDSGPYKLAITYGTESNPFTGHANPILDAFNSALPDYSRWNLTGKPSAHLPATYTESFYAGITFSFTYKKDAKGRIVQVDIKGDDKDGKYDRSITINY